MLSGIFTNWLYRSSGLTKLTWHSSTKLFWKIKRERNLMTLKVPLIFKKPMRIWMCQTNSKQFHSTMS